MKIEIVVIAEATATPEEQPTYALALSLTPFEGARDAQMLEPVVLQRGYATPRHALAALVECLTFAPPDMTAIDEGLSAVNGLLDRTNDVEQAITQLGERLNNAEDFIESQMTPAPAGGNRLLPPRPGATEAAVNLSRQPARSVAPQPPIRRPQQTVVDAGHTAGGKIKGHPGLSITGGVGRPGMLKVTGVGADPVDTDE